MKTRRTALSLTFIVGAMLVGTAHGALQFNGTDSYATIVNQSFLDGATVTDFSIDFWVKNSRPDIDQHLGGKTEFWKEWSIMCFAGGGIGFMHAWPNTYYQMDSPEGVLQADRWHHVAVVGQGTLGSIYVDGVLVHQSNSLRGEISFNASVGGSAVAGMTFGFRDNTTLPDDLWFKGQLAHFRVWDIALSAAQIASVYATSPTVHTEGLRHWIPFNEGAGSTFADIIAGVHGEVFNTVWSPEDPQPSYCSPHKATATATVFNGFVVDATITDPGCGYTETPAVLIQGGGGSGAEATAEVRDSVVAVIHITNAGSGYTSVPKIVIGSPPFVPSVSIAVSKVKVTQSVVLGRNYVLEASPDLVTWTATGPQFTAQDEMLVAEFDVDLTGRYFRIRQVP